jgi:hypothetical protein
VYKAVFESYNGEKYVFGVDGGTVFDMDVGNGTSVAVGTSQGFGQIGETVKTKSVSGRSIKIHGCIYENIISNKNRMRHIFSPFSSGRLIVDGKYFTMVHVKDAPSFSTQKNNGRFSMVLFAPFPFFYLNEEKLFSIGEVIPKFSFPVNYSNTHKFGESSKNKYINAVNDGDVSVPFSLTFSFAGDSTNPTITNLNNFAFLKINGTFTSGDSINVYRDEKNVFYAELVSNGQTEDILSKVDEDSDLFELTVGDNLIQADDEQGGASMSVNITFRTAVCSFYEN